MGVEGYALGTKRYVEAIKKGNLPSIRMETRGRKRTLREIPLDRSQETESLAVSRNKVEVKTR